jgi:hypothetical protein
MSSGFTYEIEGDVDFFKELKQMGSKLNDTSEPISLAVEDNTARCLITDEKLHRDHITLKCGHRFNYIPLFKEVLFQKCSLLPKNLSAKIITTYTKHTNSSSGSTSVAAANTSNTTLLPTNNNQYHNVTSVLYNSSYNLETTKLQYNEMKCPYCRTITPYILPYYPYPDVCKVKYVNVPTNLSLTGVSCEYEKFISGKTDEIDDIFIDERNTCRALCMYNEKYDLVLCTKHLNKLEAGTVSRKPTMTRKSKAKPKQATDLDDQNVIISHHNPATTVCSFILLSGPRKGCPCEKPMWVPKLDTLNVGPVSTNAAFCKAHYDKCVASKNIKLKI